MLLVVALLALADGGGVAADQGEEVQLGGCRFAAYGFGVRLPSGWSARILLGAEGRPLLHAASFPLRRPPRSAQLARAQAELDRLRLSDWASRP